MLVKSISFSSDRKLARCEQQFFYRYNEGLTIKRKKIGLFRGDWGHQCVEAHYKGVQSKQELEKEAWKIRLDHLYETMWIPLFDEEKEGYGFDFPQTVYELLSHYVEKWAEWDSKWEIVHVEKAFELKTKLGPPLRWKADLIVREPIIASNIRRIKSKNLFRNILVESKFKKSIPDSSERILQPQVHSYAFLLGKVGIPIHSILWNYIRTEPVKRPKINKNGSLSIRQINTDQRGYLESLREAGIRAETEEDLIALQTKLSTLPEDLSLERVINSVNLEMGEQFVRDWIERARRAQLTKRPLRDWNRNCKFDCDYYELCQVDMINKVDRNLVIQRDYNTKDQREELK